MYKPFGRRFWGYTYKDMEKDLEIFSRVFPEEMHLRSLGKTADGREIYCVILAYKRTGMITVPKREAISILPAAELSVRERINVRIYMPARRITPMSARSRFRFFTS